MKINRLVFIITILTVMITVSAHAQQKAKSTGKTGTKAKPALMKCHLSLDKDLSNKVTLDDAKAWADFTPLQVIGTDKKTYIIQQFTFTMITMSPLQTQEFGNGNGGVPFLARKAMDNLKPGDTIFLKEITAKNEAGAEMPLANIIFAIK